MLNTPVALIIFKRPKQTQQIFNAIRQAQPKQLFVIADGARNPEEAEKCQQTRDIIKQVDWDCQVYTNYADQNLGCGVRVSSGITWVFELVEEAIILEDDCLPHPSFFPYCETLLNYYRDDERIMVITGNNFQGGKKRTPYSYYFSKYPHCWGWASWRRAWQHWDYKMSKWNEFRDFDLLKFVHEDPYEQKYWLRIFERMCVENPNDIWDYMWTFACWSQNGLTVLPNVNLVSNIGFGEDGTHTFGDSPLANMPTEDIGEIIHPPFVVQHKEADTFYFDHILGGLAMKEADTLKAKLRSLLGRVKGKLKRLIKK
ncbi:MAG: glycosyltransferase family 2 protein [Gomphosphaeria aponina SAG 52.96 = DSM 107014]|uniref:Glycosyltransferase family 2 protein n=1 Tax=Gomphosphaeria aponina SAG 52.96 = DSM 107014 TaxID=1521640 RepID=A0A941GMU5_9CHRO|nr:glycosyltransferase family 2 protein [Gomphosphaeria aponina SAG 52.96 = DSM 107014]